MTRFELGARLREAMEHINQDMPAGIRVEYLDARLSNDAWVDTEDDEDSNDGALTVPEGSNGVVIKNYHFSGLASGSELAWPEHQALFDTARAQLKTKICECGAASAGSNIHSTWCPAHI